MFLDEQHLLNRRVLEYIERVKKQPGSVLIDKLDSVPSSYLEQGSYPEVVKHVWDVIGSSLPVDCRCLVYGNPALVHPKVGVILAFCNGMTHCVRLNKKLLIKARFIGAKTYTKWSDGSDMDTLRDLGPDWVLGFSTKYELKWCYQVFESLEKKRQ